MIARVIVVARRILTMYSDRATLGNRQPLAAYVLHPSHCENIYPPMQNTTTSPPRLLPEIKVERPRLHKVILVNDDFTPREFVITVLKAEFRLSEEQAGRVMMTAHQRGVCVVAVFTREVAEAKATNATDAARKKGYPLLFTTEPEE